MPKKRIEVKWEALSDKSKGTVVIEVPSYNVPSAPRVKLRRPLIRPIITPAVITQAVEAQPIPAIIEVPHGPEQIIEYPITPLLEEYDQGAPTIPV